MKNSKQTIGQRIKELREMKGLTQSQLGEVLFVSDKTISKWEKDKSEPESNSLVKMSETFNVTLDYLLTGNNPQKEDGSISTIELACRDNNLALLDGVDLDGFDDKGKNIDFYVDKYNATNIRNFLIEYKTDKYIKEGKLRKRYYICGIPKGQEGDDNLALLAWGGPLEKAAAKCAQYEKDGFHHFKIFADIGLDLDVKRDYQHFAANVLNDKGGNKIYFSTSLLDDMKTGVLTMVIYKDDCDPKAPREERVLCESHSLIKPDVMDAFLNLLSELNVDGWENKHWGCSICRLYYFVKGQSDDVPMPNKLYVAPGRDTYKKFVKGIQQLFLETLLPFPSEYRAFVNAFDTKYIPYYRVSLPLEQSHHIFKQIEEEAEFIKDNNLTK